MTFLLQSSASGSLRPFQEAITALIALVAFRQTLCLSRSLSELSVTLITLRNMGTEGCGEQREEELTLLM